MSRGDGFQIADVDSSYFEDAKLRELWRRLKDEDRMARAVCLHLSTLLASWRQGERVTLDHAAPLWLDTDDGDLLRAIIEVGLLGEDGCVNEDSFEHWFGAAVARREHRRDAGRAGGLASAKRRSTKRSPSVKQPSTPAEPDRPTDRPYRQTDASNAREGLPHINSTVMGLWEQATGRTLLASGNYAAEYLDDACRRHPESEVGAAILRARKTFDHIPDAAQLVSAMRAILDPLPDRKQVAAVEDTAKRTAANRRALAKQRHNFGDHAEVPDPDCPTCQKGAA